MFLGRAVTAKTINEYAGAQAGPNGRPFGRMASARLLPHPNDIDKIIRYEAHLSRQLYQALHELESMRAARRGQPAPLHRVDVYGSAAELAATDAATA